MNNTTNNIQEIETISVEQSIKKRYRQALKKGEVIDLCGYVNLSGNKRKFKGKLPIAKRRRIE